jgi:hypothetical protein
MPTVGAAAATTIRAASISATMPIPTPATLTPLVTSSFETLGGFITASTTASPTVHCTATRGGGPAATMVGSVIAMAVGGMAAGEAMGESPPPRWRKASAAN